MSRSEGISGPRFSGLVSERECMHTIALEIIDLIESKKALLVWALKAPRPVGEGGEFNRGTEQDVVSQLCLQFLKSNSKLHQKRGLEQSLSRLGAAFSTTAWLDLLPYFIDGLDQVYITIDLDTLGPSQSGYATWHANFADLFRRITALGICSIVKVALFTSSLVEGSGDAAAKEIQVIQIPDRSSKMPSLGVQGVRNSEPNPETWLECVRPLDLKHRRSPSPSRTGGSQTSDVDTGKKYEPISHERYSRKIILLIDNRRKMPSTWFDWWESEFDACIDLSRMDPTPQFPRVKIAILDTGTDLSHPDIANAIKEGRVKYHDFVENEATMCDSDGHGTHCSSLLLKFAPHAEIYIGRIFRASRADASSLGTLANLASGKWKVQIISISVGFTDFTAEASEKISVAAARGVLIFAAAANNTMLGPQLIRFPASLRQVFCVFSADQFGHPSSFNSNPRYDRRNLMLPGEDILGAWPGGLAEDQEHIITNNRKTYKKLSGTSCAAPIAAAVAAGVLGYVWQPRGTTSDRSLADKLKGYDAMERVFVYMLNKDSRSPASYHMLLPWRLIIKRKKKDIPGILSHILEEVKVDCSTISKF